jgi:two-component system, NarL family, response regulator LiaR
MTTSIALIEDDKIFATLMASCIEEDNAFAINGIYHTYNDAITQIPTKSFELIITDIQLPDGNGLDIVAQLQPQMPDTKFIMCTSFDDDDKIFASLKAGACGYIVKTDDPENIVAHIHDALYGGAPMSAGIALRVVKYFQQQQNPKALTILTPKENTILLHLSKGLLYKEIASLEQVSIDTIKKHCGHIYTKLHVSNRTEAINILKGN